MPEPIRLSRHSAPIRFILLHFALVVVVNLVLFAGGAFKPLASATGGILTGSLVANVIFLAILVVWLILKQGDLRITDIGILPAKLPVAILFTLGLWGVAQAIHALAGWMTYGAVEEASVWNSAGMYILIGALLAQLIGNALFEEIAYRGFLFPQIFLRLGHLAERPNGVRLGWAIIFSQTLFALSHIPNRLYLGMTPLSILPDLLMLFALGVLFTLIYVKTDNLFIVVGIHALGNTPTTLFRTAPFLESGGASLLIYALVITAFYGVPLVWANRHRLRVRPVTDDEEWIYAEESS